DVCSSELFLRRRCWQRETNRQIRNTNWRGHDDVIFARWRSWQTQAALIPCWYVRYGVTADIGFFAHLRLVVCLVPGLNPFFGSMACCTVLNRARLRRALHSEGKDH